MVWTESTHGISVGKTILCDILKQSEKWMAVSEDSCSIKSFKAAKEPRLEEALFLWFADARSHSASVNDAMLITKAKEFGEELDEYCDKPLTQLFTNSFVFLF